jgi:MoaA/NifB/PqqE/SkfB family radical SAM enzyme
MTIDLPATICFRITRYCNARCGFCLAPPDGAHPDAETLKHRIDWLRVRSVRTVHLCGGEPTIHPALGTLIAYAHASGMATKLTTNGIAMAEGLAAVLRAARTQVKVSLHGDRDHHNRIVGRDAFDRTGATIRRLLAAGVTVTVQTTVVTQSLDVLDQVAAFCLKVGIRRLSIMPFIPRGSGNVRRSEFDLTVDERRMLRAMVAKMRRALTGRLDVRGLVFAARPVHVVEADGRVVLEAATDASDTLLCRIPEAVQGLSVA